MSHLKQCIKATVQPPGTRPPTFLRYEAVRLKLGSEDEIRVASLAGCRQCESKFHVRYDCFGPPKANGEWCTGDDSGHESFVELAAIVTSHADTCASSAAIPCVVGERAGGQSPTKVPSYSQLLCESKSKLVSVTFRVMPVHRECMTVSQGIVVQAY